MQNLEYGKENLGVFSKCPIMYELPLFSSQMITVKSISRAQFMLMLPYSLHFFYIFFVFSLWVENHGYISSQKGYEEFEHSLWLFHRFLLGYLKVICGRFRTKLSHTYSLNLNYYWDISKKLFKFVKVDRRSENSNYLGVGHPIW